jgi:hypothetical protein
VTVVPYELTAEQAVEEYNEQPEHYPPRHRVTVIAAAHDLPRSVVAELLRRGGVPVDLRKREADKPSAAAPVGAPTPAGPEKPGRKQRFDAAQFASEPPPALEPTPEPIPSPPPPTPEPPPEPTPPVKSEKPAEAWYIQTMVRVMDVLAILRLEDGPTVRQTAVQYAAEIIRDGVNKRFCARDNG